MKSETTQGKYDYVILDPSSPEVNRGSFCYSPYLLHNALKEMGHSVYFIEDFSMPMFDEIPECDNLLVSVWSYPQIDTAMMVLNFERNQKPQFFGYRPMIEFYGLPLFELTREMLKLGILSYPQHYKDFKHLLLSDCDLHLKKFIKPERNNMVYPLFDSYGCAMGCKFCPSTANFNAPITPTAQELLDVIERAHKESNVHNIHFTGENLFKDTDRAHELLKGLEELNLDMYFICLATAPSLMSYIRKYGTDAINNSGMKLIEVGFESASPEMQKAMGKVFNKDVEELGKLTRDNEFEVFWLTMTFFPGDCIKSLNVTGEFLTKYGFSWEDVHPRIATNSTVGGLGQYFQPYHGTSGFTLDEITKYGKLLTHRPLRLRPSFLPNSFLDEKVIKAKDWSESDLKWLDLYNLTAIDKSLPTEPMMVKDFIKQEMENEQHGLLSNGEVNWEHDKVVTIALKLGLAGRLGCLIAV